MEIRYKILLFVLLLVIFILFSIKFNKAKMTNKKPVANTLYVRETSIYKKLYKNYKIFYYLILVFCAIIMITSAILISRPYKEKNKESGIYNRDIFLCMDVSTSIDENNLELINSYKKIIKQLDGERFGISIFNTSSVLLSPLTDDYTYVDGILNNLEKSILAYYDYGYDPENELVNYRFSGTLVGNEIKGSSLVPNGLTSCMNSFTNKDEERTRIIIFSTDNDQNGESLLTLDEASKIAKKKNIIVYGVSVEGIYANNNKEFKDAVLKTGGAFYKSSYNNSISKIVKSIETKSKAKLKENNKTRKEDIPIYFFIPLILSTVGLFYCVKKVII